jgi:hypothetical protein
MESNSGITRRDVLKRGAVAGGAVLWAVPVVQVIGRTASHAEAASGGGGTPTSHPTPTATGTGGPAPAPTTPTGTTPANVLPTELSQVPTPTVQGISCEQPPPAVAPTATLPFTGAAVPVTGTVALGAGLVATGVAAVAATRRRQQAGAVATDVSADDEQPPSA